MSLGLVKDRRQVSKYERLPPIQGDLTTIMVGLADRLIESAMTMRRLEQALAAGLDRKIAAEEAGSVSSGLAQAARFASSAGTVIDRRITELIEGNVSDVRYGITQGFTFTGGAPEDDTITVIGQDWVVAGVSVVIPISNNPPRTSAVEAYIPQVANYVNGVGFDLTLYAPTGSLAANDYELFWMGFPDGVTVF